MEISLDNAVKAASEYLAEEFAGMKPNLMNAGMSIYAQYKLQTQGRKIMKTLDDGDGKINLDVLGSLVEKYMGNLPDQSLVTPLGELKITADTPAKLIEHMKKYGEN